MQNSKDGGKVTSKKPNSIPSGAWNLFNGPYKCRGWMPLMVLRFLLCIGGHLYHVSLLAVGCFVNWKVPSLHPVKWVWRGGSLVLWSFLNLIARGWSIHSSCPLTLHWFFSLTPHGHSLPLLLLMVFLSSSMKPKGLLDFTNEKERKLLNYTYWIAARQLAILLLKLICYWLTKNK